MRGASVTQESERVEDVSDRQLAINLFYAQNPSMSEMAWSIKGDVKNIFSLHRGRGIVRAIQPSRHWKDASLVSCLQLVLVVPSQRWHLL